MRCVSPPQDRGRGGALQLDPVASPRTPPPCRASRVPWSPEPSLSLRETPSVCWAEVAKAQSQSQPQAGPNGGKQHREPRDSSGPLSPAPATPQPFVPWCYVASPPMGSPLSRLGEALESPPEAHAQWLEPFGMGMGMGMGMEASFSWPGGDRGLEMEASPLSPLSRDRDMDMEISPFRIRGPFPSPPPLDPAPAPAPLNSLRTFRDPQEELMLSEDPNLGRLRRDFAETQLLARGQFSAVYAAKHVIDGQHYAVKVQANSAVSDRNAPVREVVALAAVSSAGPCCTNPNVIRYYGAWKEDDRMHIQMELCETSLRAKMQDLASRRPELPRFEQESIVDVLRQVANGLALLHRVGYVHLDVKPDNILWSHLGCFKIADFGLATLLSSRQTVVPEGDCRYLAKEVLQGTYLDLTKADVFSLGLVCYELATNPRELPQNGDAWQALRDGPLDTTELGVSDDLARLLLCMVHKIPSERPECKELALALTEQRERREADELAALRRELCELRKAAAQNEALGSLYHAKLEHQRPLDISSLGG